MRLLHARFRDVAVRPVPRAKRPHPTLPAGGGGGGGGGSRNEVNDWIAGNLCRCTGYRPIVDAAIAACAATEDRFTEHEPETARAVAMLDDGDDVVTGSPERFFAAPSSIDALARLYTEHPDAVLVSGATDVG